MNILKKAAPWIVSAALCLLAVEILGAAMFYWNTKSLVYFNQPRVDVSEPVAETVYRRRLHPYFGYTGPYSVRGSHVTPTNNLGFIQVQEREVPFQPEPNDFIVFVFGASVASKIANNSQFGISLPAALQKLPQLAGKNIVIYNAAQGPGKQPQQLMELAFLIALGQHIDLVLNLDGTLEFFSGLRNFAFGVDPVFPPVEIYSVLGNELAPAEAASEQYYELAYGVTHARTEAKRYALLLATSTSGIAFIKNTVFKAVYDRSLETKVKAYDQTITGAPAWEDVRKLTGLDMPINTSEEKIIEYSFDIWLRCSGQMQVMANSIGAAYLNIALPNPYHTRKVLTESEKTALDNHTPVYLQIRQGSSEGLAFIETHGELLKAHGIVSGATLFDDTADTVYIDGSGHLNKLGETMLTEFVAHHVGLKLGSQQEK